MPHPIVRPPGVFRVRGGVAPRAGDARLGDSGVTVRRTICAEPSPQTHRKRSPENMNRQAHESAGQEEIDMKHRVGDGSTGPVLVLPDVPARAWIGGDGAGEDGHL